MAKNKTISCSEFLTETKEHWVENAFKNFAYLNKKRYQKIENQLDCFLGKTETEVKEILGEPTYKTKGIQKINIEYHYFIEKTKKHPQTIYTISLHLDDKTGKIIKTGYGRFGAFG